MSPDGENLEKEKVKPSGPPRGCPLLAPTVSALRANVSVNSANAVRLFAPTVSAYLRQPCPLSAPLCICASVMLASAFGDRLVLLPAIILGGVLGVAWAFLERSGALTRFPGLRDWSGTGLSAVAMLAASVAALAAPRNSSRTMGLGGFAFLLNRQRGE